MCSLAFARLYSPRSPSPFFLDCKLICVGEYALFILLENHAWFATAFDQCFLIPFKRKLWLPVVLFKYFSERTRTMMRQHAAVLRIRSSKTILSTERVKWTDVFPNNMNCELLYSSKCTAFRLRIISVQEKEGRGVVKGRRELIPIKWMSRNILTLLFFSALHF